MERITKSQYLAIPKAYRGTFEDVRGDHLSGKAGAPLFYQAMEPSSLSMAFPLRSWTM